MCDTSNHSQGLHVSSLPFNRAMRLLADKNTQLIEVYEVVRDDPEKVYDRVTALPRTRRVYYAQRSRDPKDLRPIELRRSICLPES